MLEQLLARHIILPSRSMFLAAREQLGPNPSSDNTPLSLLDPLNRIDLSTVPNSAPTSEDKLDRRALSAIPMVFDVAIRCLPRDTPRKKVNEAPWLETMFLRLTNQLSEIAKDMNQRSLEMLEHMLQTAIDRKISLDTTVLRDIITYFDVFKDGPLGCQWTLVAKILELDANVFLMPTDGYHSHTGSSPSINGLLDTLFSHITTGARTVPHKHSEDYRLIKSRIVLPLVRELAQARDLSGFLHYWRKELITLEESLTGSTTRDLSVWEDLDLANELRGLVESSLTLGQINTALSWALPDLKTFAERGSKEFSGAYASSIILDAILSAIQRDETTDSVSRIVQSIGQAITALTYPDSAWPYDHRWRLWRIATLINVQWPHAWSFFSAMNNGDSRVDGSPGGSRALGAFSGLILSDSGLEGMSGRRLEGLYSFQSILGLAFVEAGDRNMSAKPLESIDLAFIAIVPLLAHAIIQARHGAKASEFQWNGRPESVISSQIMIVALAISILRYPQSLV